MKPLFKYHCQIETQEGVIDTWGIYPITSDTKILDGIYDPVNKTLKLLFDSVREMIDDVPVRKKDGKYEYQQRRVDQYYKGAINEEDLPFFLDKYVDNNFEFKEKSVIITNE